MNNEHIVTRTWVVVAHQTGARFLEHRPGFGRNLTLVREIECPDGRKKNHELESDRAGDSFTGARSNGGRRAMHHEHAAHDQVVERFVREIADKLRRARAEGLFNDLILVAEPHFLGMLRDALDTTTARHVVSSVSKDLASVPPHSIASHIAEVLPL